MDKVIITAALTGAVTPKEKNASIPLESGSCHRSSSYEK